VTERASDLAYHCPSIDTLRNVLIVLKIYSVL